MKINRGSRGPRPQSRLCDAGGTSWNCNRAHLLRAVGGDGRGSSDKTGIKIDKRSRCAGPERSIWPESPDGNLWSGGSDLLAAGQPADAGAAVSRRRKVDGKTRRSGPNNGVKIVARGGSSA